jgi:ComF family protein
MSCEKYIIKVAKIQANGYNSSMTSLFGQLLDLIFPPCCAICKKNSRKIICDDCLSKVVYIKTPICRVCGKPRDKYFAGDLCEDCSRESMPFEIARSVVLYDGAMKEAIHKFKFEGKRSLSLPLGEFLVDYLKRGYIPVKKIDAIIPLPLSKKRERQRGYNQSELLAREVAKHFSVDIDSSSLRKVKDITPQFELSRKDRLSNVKGAFRSSPLKEKSILLVDDIFTTGATVREASRALKEAGAASVYVLTLARAACPEES